MPDAHGRFAFNVRLPQPTPTIGIWVGSDADDSHSKFTVWLKKIELEATPQARASAPSTTINLELTT